MRQITRAALLSAALGAAIAASPADAATSVAYLDGNEVWVANTDGSSKTRLSGGEGDWRAVSQNAQGWIIGVENPLTEDGNTRIPDLATFKVWNPQGALAAQGPLRQDGFGPSYAYPLGLELTSTGGNLLYGFSALTPAFPVGIPRTGFFLTIPTAAALQPTAVAAGGFSNGIPTHFTLVNDRVVGNMTNTAIGIQDASSIASKNFSRWSIFDLPAGNLEYREVDASADATVVATGLAQAQQGPSLMRIAFWKTTGLGGDYVNDCILDAPIDTVTGHPTVSPDGAVVAWHQTGGVKITSVPTLQPGGPATCQLPAPVTTISATGKYPSLGGFDLTAYIASKTPPTTGAAAGGGGGAAGGTASGPGAGSGTPNTPPALQVKVGAAPKLSTGSSKQSLKITPQATGTANVTITIEPKSVGQKGKTPISLATGSQKVTAGKQATVKLKPSKKAKSLKKKLKGKKATIKIQIGSAVYTGTIKLG